MNKETFYSLIRTLAIGVGSYLVGTNTNILGNPINAELWEAIVGGVVALAATIWGIVDKTATIEATQSGIRSVVSVIGGMLVASGKIKAEVLASAIGVIGILVPVWQSHLARKKLTQIESGKLQIIQTTGNISKNVRPMATDKTVLKAGAE
jgi:hypothetical protein